MGFYTEEPEPETHQLRIAGEVWKFCATPLRLRLNGSAVDAITDEDDRTILVTTADGPGHAALHAARAVAGLSKRVVKKICDEQELARQAVRGVEKTASPGDEGKFIRSVGPKKIGCPFCSRTCTYMTTLERHMQAAHGKSKEQVAALCGQFTYRVSREIMREWEAKDGKSD